MRDLVVDLTPTCINKTAIFHIALETARALGSCCRTAFQYRGVRAERAVSPQSEKAIASAFFQDLSRWACRPLRHEEVRRVALEEDQAPRLYFDPIYTLYRELNQRDVVFVLDLSPLTDPEWHNPVVAKVYEQAFCKIMGSPARIVCISEDCATMLRTSFSIRAADITTVPLYLRTFERSAAARQNALSSRLEVGRFLLFVGSLETRKNVEGLIHAFAMSGLAESGWKLVCAGGNGQGADAILEAAEEVLGVEMLGFVSDDELAWLYANAAVFAYPSFLEGFGLPLLEAMSHGLPCVASITGASKEICGEHGILVDPYSLPSVVDGLMSCVRKSDQTDREQLMKRARDFTFQRYFDALRPALGLAPA